MLAGLAPGLEPEQQFARRLVEMGCQVVVPVLIDREHTWSGNPAIRMTDQPHREYIYRMACEMGRHVIGYEVQKLLALLDYFAAQAAPEDVPVAAFGYGEGGLLALYSGALDERIGAVGVSGYFRNRTQLWQEPLYRNVWRLLRGFGDAELAALIAPRPLIIEATAAPTVIGLPPITDLERVRGRVGAPGKIEPAPLDEDQGGSCPRATGLYCAYDSNDSSRAGGSVGGRRPRTGLGSGVGGTAAWLGHGGERRRTGKRSPRRARRLRPRGAHADDSSTKS